MTPRSKKLVTALSVIVVRFREFGIEAECGGETLRGLLQPPCRQQNNAEVIVQRRLGRIELDRLLEGGDRFSEPPLLHESEAVHGQPLSFARLSRRCFAGLRRTGRGLCRTGPGHSRIGECRARGWLLLQERLEILGGGLRARIRMSRARRLAAEARQTGAGLPGLAQVL